MKKNILIVDDDKSILSIFEFILKEKYAPLIIDNGPDALPIIKDNNIHLIILDARLKNYIGIELFKQIQKLKPHIPIILMTGHKTKELIAEIFEVGPKFVVYKPFDIEEILNLIDITIK